MYDIGIEEEIRMDMIELIAESIRDEKWKEISAKAFWICCNVANKRGAFPVLFPYLKVLAAWTATLLWFLPKATKQNSRWKLTPMQRILTICNRYYAV